MIQTEAAEAAEAVVAAVAVVVPRVVAAVVAAGEVVAHALQYQRNILMNRIISGGL